jgi:hypothetical protein
VWSPETAIEVRGRGVGDSGRPQQHTAIECERDLSRGSELVAMSEVAIEEGCWGDAKKSRIFKGLDGCVRMYESWADHVEVAGGRRIEWGKDGKGMQMSQVGSENIRNLMEYVNESMISNCIAKREMTRKESRTEERLARTHFETPFVPFSHPHGLPMSAPTIVFQPLHNSFPFPTQPQKRCRPLLPFRHPRRHLS